MFRKVLNKRLSSKNIQPILADLSSFFNRDLPRKIISIYLFASPKESSGIGGSAFLEKKAMILEVRDLTSISEYILIILHEIAHEFLEKYSTRKIKKIAKGFRFPSNKLVKERGKIGLINELIICSLVPNGYLAEKYFNIPVRKLAKKHLRKFQKQLPSSVEWRLLEQYIIYHLYPLAKSYIKNKKA